MATTETPASEEWERTMNMSKRLELEGKLSDSGSYSGRSIICRDSPIDGCVCLGEYKREAILVDFQNSTRIKNLYEKVKMISSIDGKIQRDKILEAVYDESIKAFPVKDQLATIELINRLGKNDDGLIGLEVFIEEGIGVCRHLALLCGVLLERFKKEGIIRGQVSIDRNSSYLGGHAWCRYTSYQGIPVILDAKIGYYGALSEAPKFLRKVYARPEDKLQIQKSKEATFT